MTRKIYKFWKNDCTPCRALSKKLETMKIPDDVEIISLNIDNENNFQLAIANGISSVPALLDEKGNKLIGLMPDKEIIEFINRSANEISNRADFQIN